MKNEKKFTLKYRIIFSGFAAIFIPFFIVGIIIYIQLSNSLLELSKEKSVSTAKDISSIIDLSLKHEIRFASSIAADPVIMEASKTGDYHSAQLELDAVYKRVGRKFFTIFLTDKNGISRADAHTPRQLGLDLSDREYFLKAKNGKECVSGPIISRGTTTPGAPIIIVSVPIQENNEFYGIVALAFNTDFLVDILSQKKLGRTGYAYLLNSQGIVLVHPKKELILRLHLLDQPGTEEVGKLIREKKTGTASYLFDGTENIAGLARVNLTGWIVAFTQSRDEIMSPVNEILHSIFISGIIFLIITILIIIFSSRRISSPISKMMEMTKQVTQYSNEIIVQIGLDRRIFFTNPAFEKITGIKTEDIIGTRPVLDNPNNISPDAIWDSLEAGISWSGRVIIQGNSPDPITLDVMIIPLKDDRGATHGYLEIGRDITTELMFEKRIQQAQKLEAIGTLAGGIAHDFNNILSGIFGFAELALIKTKSSPDAENYIRQIIMASERARDLVSQILTFSRKTDVELKPLLPKYVVKEALTLLRASIPATIEIQPKINSDSIILAEPTQIHQIVMNLFTNSVHAIGSGAGTIKLELEDFWVDEEFTKTHPNINQGKHIVLRVSDTGCGIGPEIIDHIYEPFFTRKSPGEGTGLGLSVVHGIVNDLGGIITAYSEIGKGTTFNIFVPCVESEDTKPYQGSPLIEGGSQRIVLIDDEIPITSTIQAILDNLGYQVTSFTDATAALTEILASPDHFDLIITDHSMPQITGLEIAKKCKDSGIKIPIILSSGFISQDIEKAARETGISVLLTKPVTIYQLVDAIHRALNSTALPQ